MISKTYDRIKTVALVILPLLGALYIGAAELWGLPYAVQVAGTLALIDTFLGALVKRLSTAHKNEVKDVSVVGNLTLLTDLDGVPTGRFRLPDDAFDGIMFENDKLVSLRVKRKVEQR